MGAVNNVDYSTLTVTNSSQVVASAASPAMTSRAKGAIITLESAPIRWRDDGTAPTASEGHLMNPGDVLTFDSWQNPGANWEQVLNAIRVIRVTDQNGLLKISWYD